MLEKNGIWSVFCRNTSAILYCLKNGEKRKRIAFTLTEMLIALVVVAILAVLILPVVTTRAQNKSFAMSYESQVRQMLNSLTGLHVMENVPDFKDTMMYIQGDTDDYSSSSGAYIKKYMKVSKYCGDNADNRTSGCFADRYYQYKDNDREVYEIEFDGACALLKNGASICLRPQSGAAVGSHTVEGFIDLNGPKGPNVFGRDLRTFRIDLLEHIAYDESDPMETIITPDPAVGCVGSECIVPDECLTDPSSEACCKVKVLTGPADPCCLWHGNPAASGYSICHPEEEEIEENCQNHTITSPGDPCCAQINDPKCCSPNDDSAFCCATANSGSKACCLAGIQGGTITLNSEHPCCTNFPEIKEQYPQLCIPPCTLDEQTNRTAINPKTEQPYGDKWREGRSLQKPEGGSSYCCDYFSRRKEILSPPGSGPRDGCCMFEDVYNDEFNPVSASHCCRLQKFPKETPAVNELCCSWRFFETDLDGKSWLKTHGYYTDRINDADNPVDDEGKDYDEKKFDTCCPYALSQVIKENPPAPWDTPEHQDKVWKNCCTLKHLTPECCHFLVERAPEYGPQALMDIDPRTINNPNRPECGSIGCEGVLRQGCCGYEEFKDVQQCCSRDIDGIQTFQNNEWREVCCMPNSVYTTELTTLNGPSVDCCINAGEQITNENHKWWWKREAKFGNPERNNRLDGCCNQGLQTSSEGTALRKYPKWQVNCCYLRWVNSNAYETAEDFVTGCCSSSADNPAGEEAWGDVNRDDDRNEDCCAAYGSPDDPAHNRINDSRWYTRCCSPTKRVNTSLNYNYHYKDAGCCKNVNWRDDDNEDCCTYAVDVKDGQKLRDKNDSQWFANCCNHFEDYRGLNNGQGYKTYVSNCCINDKTTANDGMRKDEFGGTPNTLTRKGEPFLKYCCDTTIAENNGNAPSENCCWSFVEDGSGMQTDYDDKALSEAYRGNCCKAYGSNERNGNSMRDSITNITCPELWICEGNGIDRATQADSLNNPGYGLPSCCIASKQHNDNDYWRGACCEFPTYYTSNADYRSICCSPDPSVDYTRENVAEFNTSVRGTDDVEQKKYCCKPDIADNGYLPSTNCCSYFKGRSNYGKDNDNHPLSERYQIECCELSTGAVNSDEDYCSTCDIRWKTGEEKHPEDLSLADAEWNQWNFSDCCRSMHSSHGETDLWLNNCCSFVGDTVQNINDYYGSHEKFREHCCNVPPPPEACGAPSAGMVSKRCCDEWGETAILANGLQPQCCAIPSYRATHGSIGQICFGCPDEPDPTKVTAQCCEQWGETKVANAGLTTQCCATQFGNSRNNKGDFCNPCSATPKASDVSQACCNEWKDNGKFNNGANSSVLSSCCGSSGGNFGASNSAIGGLCYECPNSPTPGHTSAACCGNWSESAIASAGLTTACCSNPEYAANHSGTGHICYSCPANPASGDVSEECCSQWKTNGKFNNGANASVLTSCCGSAGGNFGANNSAIGGLCYTCPATPQSGHESETCCKQWKDNNKFNSSNTSIKNTCCGFEQFNTDNSAEGGLCEACPFTVDAVSYDCCKQWGTTKLNTNETIKNKCCENPSFKNDPTYTEYCTPPVSCSENPTSPVTEVCCAEWGNKLTQAAYATQKSECCGSDGGNFASEHADICNPPCNEDPIEISMFTSETASDRECFKLLASRAVTGDVSIKYYIDKEDTSNPSQPIITHRNETLTIPSGEVQSTGQICLMKSTWGSILYTESLSEDNVPEVSVPASNCPEYNYTDTWVSNPNCSENPTSPVSEQCCNIWGNKLTQDAYATQKSECCEIPNFFNNNEELCPCNEEPIVITAYVSGSEIGTNDYDGAVTYWVKLKSNKPVAEDVTVAYNIRTTKTNDLDFQTFDPYDEQKTLTIKAGETESEDSIELYFDNKGAIWIGSEGSINYDTNKFINGEGVATLPESDCPSYSYKEEITLPDTPTICDPATADASAPCCSWWMGGRYGEYDESGESAADWNKLSAAKKQACCDIANNMETEDYVFDMSSEPWKSACTTSCPAVNITVEHDSHTANSFDVKGKAHFKRINSNLIPDGADVYISAAKVLAICSEEEWVADSKYNSWGGAVHITSGTWSDFGYYVTDLFENRSKISFNEDMDIVLHVNLPYINTNINKSYKACRVVGLADVEIDMDYNGTNGIPIFSANYGFKNVTDDLAISGACQNGIEPDEITCPENPDSGTITEFCCKGWADNGKLEQEAYSDQKAECCGIPKFNEDNSELCSNASCPPITLENATKENCQCWKESLPKNPYIGQYDWDTVVPDEVKAECCKKDPDVSGNPPYYCCNTCPTWTLGAYITDYTATGLKGEAFLKGNNVPEGLILAGGADIMVTCTSAFPGYENSKFEYTNNVSLYYPSDMKREFIKSYSNYSYPTYQTAAYQWITNCSVTGVKNITIDKDGIGSGEFYNEAELQSIPVNGKAKPCTSTYKNKVIDSCVDVYPDPLTPPETCNPITDANAQNAENCECWYNNSATYWSVVTDKQKEYCCATGFKDSHPDICPSGSTCSTVNEANATKECCKEWKNAGTLSSAPTAVRDKCCKDNKIGNCALYAPEYKWGVGVYTQDLKHPSSGAYISQGGYTHGPWVVFDVYADNGATLRFDPDHSFTADVQFELSRYGVNCITNSGYAYAGNTTFHALNYSTDLTVPTDVPYASCNTERSYVWDYNTTSLIQSGTTTDNTYGNGSTCVVYENIPDRTNNSYCTIGGASTGNSGHYTIEGADPYIYSFSIGGGVYYRKVNSSEYKSSVDATWCSSSHGGSYAECKGYVLYDDSPDAVWLDISSTNAPNGFKKVPGMTTSDASDGTTRIASIWNKFIAKLNEIKIAIANAFRNTIAKLFNINISTRTAQTDAQISVPQTVDSPAVAKLTRGKYTQGYKAQNTQAALDNIAESVTPKAHAATVRTVRTVPSAAVAKLTKNKYAMGHVAFAEESLLAPDMVRKETNTISAIHCCVPEHTEPTEECCRAFKANQWKDFDGNQLSYVYKLTCCNNHNVCPEVDFCTPTDIENHTQLYENCLVLADTGNPDRWAIKQCCACLADYAQEHITTEGTALKNHERWRKTCCKEAIGASEEATKNKIGLDNAGYKEHCCLPTDVDGTKYLGSDGSLWGSGTKDERCCNYEQSQANNASSFCCGKRQTAMNWQLTTTPAQEEGTDAEYRKQCCLKGHDNHKYCSCKQSYDKSRQGYSDLNLLFGGGTNIMVPCCENLNKEFNKAGETKWQETCCSSMIDNAANTSQILDNDTNFRQYCCTTAVTGSDGSVKGLAGASAGNDERCCSYTAAYANQFCCEKKSTAKNTDGSSQVIWTDTGDGNETSEFRNACCSSVNDQFCTCTGLYGKYPNASDLFSHMGSTRGVTCCNDLYSSKSSETLWKQACCPVAKNNTVQVVGDNNTFRSVCCDSSKYSCIYSYDGTCNSNADSTDSNGKDWRCCSDASGNMPASDSAKLGAGNYFCCSNLSNVSEGSHDHSDATRDAGCCKSEGIRYGGGADVGCCTFNASNEITEKCCSWRRDGANANDTWSPWIGLLSNDSFRSACCTKFPYKSSGYCTCQYYYDNDVNQLDTNCCDTLHGGSADGNTSAHGDEFKWKQSCCSKTVPGASGTRSGAVAEDAWKDSCCKWSDSNKGDYYNNDSVGCCEWRAINKVFDTGINAFEDTTYDGCCAYNTWKDMTGDGGDTVYHEHCCKAGVSTDYDCCRYMYDKDSDNTNIFTPGSGCCNTFNTRGFIVDECLTPCDHYYRQDGHASYSDDSVKRSCCTQWFNDQYSSIDSTHKSLCCHLPASNNIDYQITNSDHYGSQCCSERTASAGSDFSGRSTVYYYTYAAEVRGTCSWDDNDCSAYKYGNDSSYCTSLTCSKSRTADRNKYCCLTAFYDMDLQNNTTQNNATKKACCSFSEFASHNSLLCTCKADNGSRILTSEACCEWWRDTSATCCAYDSIRENNMSACCGWNPNSSIAEDWKDCCEYWGINSVKGNSSALTECCKDDDFYDDHEAECLGCSANPSTSYATSACCDYWDRMGKFSGGSYSSVKNYCDCGGSYSSGKVSGRCCNYWSGMTSAQKQDCCDETDYYNNHEAECLGCSENPSTSYATSDCCDYWDRKGKFNNGSYSSVKNYCDCGSSYSSSLVSGQCCNYWSGMTDAQIEVCCGESDYSSAHADKCPACEASNAEPNADNCDCWTANGLWSTLDTSHKHACCANHIKEDNTYCKPVTLNWSASISIGSSSASGSISGTIPDLTSSPNVTGTISYVCYSGGGSGQININTSNGSGTGGSGCPGSGYINYVIVYYNGAKIYDSGQSNFGTSTSGSEILYYTYKY